MNIGNVKKQQILENISYTKLVYSRINKKLGLVYSNDQIENYILNLLAESSLNNYSKIGKNYYVFNSKHKIRVTINSNTFRIITVDKII